MLEIKDIEKLATLSRIDLTEKEKEKFLKDVGPILDYVIQIKEVSGTAERTAGEHRNVMREDNVEYKTGENSPEIIANFPEKDRDYLKVKKIL